MTPGTAATMRSLKSISAFISKGATPTTYGFKWQASGVPFLRSECVSDHGLDLKQAMFVSPAADAALQRSRVREGDILMTITGYVGRVIRLHSFHSGNINQHIARIRINDEGFDPGFIYHYLSQPWIKANYETITTGQAYPQISLTQVRETEIPVLPVDTQRRIATSLDAADDLVSSLERLIAKKREIKQGLMQELLSGRIRLPGFSGQWRSVTFGDVVRIQRGSTLTRAQAGKGRIPVIAGGKIPAGYTDQPNRTGRTITISASGASAGYVAIYNGKIFASDCSTISSSKAFDLDFIYYSLLLRQDAIYRAQTGGAQPHIHARDIYPIEVQMPMSIDEQNTISRVLRDADDEIAALERRLESARAIKQGMMQELLTGRTRLTEEVAA